MHGLTCVRQLTISEGHNVIRPDQAEEELQNCFDAITKEIREKTIREELVEEQK